MFHVKHIGDICRHLPNGITICRAVLAVPVAIALYRGGAASIPYGLSGVDDRHPLWAMLAVALILLLAASDWLDGWLARRLGAGTRLGQLLDPIADKIVFGTSFLALAAVSGMRAEVVCPVLIVIVRDLTVTVKRLRPDGARVLAPSPAARIKTGAQAMVLAAAPVLGLTGTETPFGYLLWLAGLWFVAALSLWTGVAYARMLWRSH